MYMCICRRCYMYTRYTPFGFFLALLLLIIARKQFPLLVAKQLFPDNLFAWLYLLHLLVAVKESYINL